jgi:hypothetical protein
MTVEIYPTKIEMVDSGKALVTVFIQSDIGILKLDLVIESMGGDANAILQKARESLQNFGNELLNKAGKQPLRLWLPPKSE